MLSHILPIVLLAAFVAAQEEQKMIKQCLCSEIEPCMQKYMSTWKPCVEQCKSQLSGIVSDINKLSNCLETNKEFVQSIPRCLQFYGEETCAKSPEAVKFVSKRYPEALEISMISEMNRMIKKMGIEEEIKSLMGVRRKMIDCTRKCMTTNAENCEKTLRCGLDYPPDNVAVQKIKQCAIGRGLNTANAQTMCNCAVAAGIKNLTPAVCAKVKIT